MSAHTPGPWKLWKERTTGERIVLGGDAAALCDVHPCHERAEYAHNYIEDDEARGVLVVALNEARVLLAEIDGGTP